MDAGLAEALGLLRRAKENYLRIHKTTILNCSHERVIEAPRERGLQPRRLCINCRVEEEEVYGWNLLKTDFVKRVSHDELWGMRLAEKAEWIPDRSNINESKPAHLRFGPDFGIPLEVV